MSHDASSSTVSTHAHPCTPPSPRTTPESYDSAMGRLSSIYYKDLLANGLQLGGLQGEGRSSAIQVYCPEVRRSYFNDNSPISHLDSVSCWRGLDMKQAEDILSWELVFRKALEEQIADNVRKLLPTIPAVDDDTFTVTHYVDVDLEYLVHTMLNHYYLDKLDQRPESGWASANGDLPGFAYNFVCTRDCFIDTCSRPCVQISLLFSPFMSSVVGEVIWQRPNLEFSDLPNSLPPGASYMIHPKWRSPDCGNASGPRFTVFPGNADFMVDSHCLPFETSDAGHTYLFKAVVPHVDESSSASPTLETTLTAKRTVQFPAGVRFQRTSRYSIKLSVVIQNKSLQSGDTSLRLSRRMDSMSPESKLPAVHHPVMNQGRINEAKAEPVASSAVISPRCPSFAECKKHSNARISAALKEHINSITLTDKNSGAHYDDRPTKRKAKEQMPVSSLIAVTPFKSTQFALLELDDESTRELTAKRQRIWPSGAVQSTLSDTMYLVTDENNDPVDAWTDKHMDDLGHLSTTCVGEAQTGYAIRLSTPPKESCINSAPAHGSKSRAYTTSTGKSRVMPALRKKGSVKRILFNHAGRAHRADSPVEADPSTVANEENLTPVSPEDLELSHEEAWNPDQATIRRNYDEFVQKSMHLKLDSDEARESKEYESFFLNSPSGASSVSDGLSAMSLGAD
ncbi:hypothetical protein PMIN03_003594 [Paraphaeosphaeria minitans]|uniref:Uncharacterized protein n=1 Tax=Paraphaeosphaeria minitans TaxID=565426 RepID=A0A9P6KT04_9PLEO|nr:hypothetical protein PMIN01_05023 [Paraphaeosphaeria minitans]